jgi:hypothetical protein
MLLTQLLPLEPKAMVKLNTPPPMFLQTTLEQTKNWYTPMPMFQVPFHQKLETPLITMELLQELPPVTPEEQLLTKFTLHLQKSPSDIPQEAMLKPPLGIFFAIQLLSTQRSQHS